MTRSLRARIGTELVAAGCDGWCWAHPVGEEAAGVGVGADSQTSISSMYKVHLLAAFCLAVDRGLLNPLDAVTLSADDGPVGTPGVGLFADPVTMSLRDLVRQMVVLSDSIAARVLQRRLPPGLVGEVVSLANLEDTTIVAPGTTESELPALPEDGSAASEAIRLLAYYPRVRQDPAAYRSVSTPRQLCRLLDWIWTGPDLTGVSRAFTRTVLGQQVWGHRIPSGFPAGGVRFHGKTGTIGPVRGEVSVVAVDEEAPIVVAVITRSARSGPNLAAADAAIGRIARLLVDELRMSR